MAETLFMLAYGSEVVLPVEVTLHTDYLTIFQEEFNNAALREAFDLLPSFEVMPSSEKHSTNSDSHDSMIPKASFTPSRLEILSSIKQKLWHV